MEKRTSLTTSRSAIGAFEEFRSLIQQRESELEPLLSPRNMLARMYADTASPGNRVGLLGNSGKPPAGSPGPTVEALSRTLKQHIAYRRLMQSENFVRALQIFRDRRASEPDPAQAAIDELRFIEHILDWVGFSIHVANTGWQPRSVSARQKRRALLHANQLLSDIKGGVRMKDFTSNSLLEQMLATFCAELSAPGKRDYAGHGRERTVLTTLAFSLLGGDKLPRDAVVEIVSECAQLYGFEITVRSIQRYVREARRRRNEALAQFLLQRQKS